MKNKQTKQIFYYMLLLGVIIAPCFMYVPPIYGCTVDSITLYTGSSSTSLTASALRIPQGSNAYYYARCTVTNPNQYRILWEFDIDGNGVYEYLTITYYDSSGYYLKAPSSTASRYFSNSGTFNARVRCCLIDASGSAVSSYVSDTCDIYVVGVASVSAGGVTSETDNPGASETVHVAKGSPGATIPVTAAPNPSVAWPSGKPTWDGAVQAYEEEIPIPGQATFPIDTVTSSSGVTVTATCGTSSKAIKIVVVGIEKMQYKIGSDSYQDAPGTLTVAKGADVTFKAIKTPSSATWPSGNPVWSGSSGASGTGETKGVSFNTGSGAPTDYKAVTATCGSSSATVNVVVVDLSLLAINANRTSSPPESSFPVKSGEHFECGGTFKFDLDMNDGTYTWPQPEKMGAEIWDYDWWNEVIASGTGISITYTFGPAQGTVDDGTCATRFYFDNNSSGNSTGGFNDPWVNSPYYEVMEFEEHSLTFARSTAVAAAPNYATACGDATDLVLKKDTADDWRAIAKFTVAGIHPDITEMDSSTNPPTDRDPVIYKAVLDQQTGKYKYFDTWGYAQYWLNRSTNVVVVEKIEGWLPDANGQPGQWHSNLGGTSQKGVKYKILMRLQDTNGKILAHEVGHSCGLDDLDNSPSELQRVMWWTTANNHNLLTQSERNSFE